MALRKHDNFRRYVLAIQYHGGQFLGFSRQTGAEDRNGLPITIESRISQALSSFVGCDNFENIQVSSRTDRGVHAIWNTMHVDLRPINERMLSSMELHYGLNHHLWKKGVGGARVMAVGKAPLSIPNPFYKSGTDEPKEIDWNARFTAVERTYCYRTVTSRDYNIPFDHDRAWRLTCRRLDVEKMIEASQSLVGTHDFTSFRGKKCARKTAIVTVKGITIREVDKDFMMGPHRPQVVTISVTGTSFLYRQVRNMVGCLVNVGMGRLEPDDVRDFLEVRNRNKAPQMAPAHGLFLVDVKHDYFSFGDVAMDGYGSRDHDNGAPVATCEQIHSLFLPNSVQ